MSRTRKIRIPTKRRSPARRPIRRKTPFAETTFGSHLQRFGHGVVGVPLPIKRASSSDIPLPGGWRVKHVGSRDGGSFKYSYILYHKGRKYATFTNAGNAAAFAKDQERKKKVAGYALRHAIPAGKSILRGVSHLRRKRNP